MDEKFACFILAGRLINYVHLPAFKLLGGTFCLLSTLFTAVYRIIDIEVLRIKTLWLISLEVHVNLQSTPAIYEF